MNVVVSLGNNGETKFLLISRSHDGFGRNSDIGKLAGVWIYAFKEIWAYCGTKLTNAGIGGKKGYPYF